jgi:hypothetical protein
LEDIRKKIERLVATDKLEAALSELSDLLANADADLRSELIQHEGTLSRATRDRRRGLIETAQAEQTRNRVGYALLEILLAWSRDQTPDPVPPADDDPPTKNTPTVFISYSRTDVAVAERIKSALESRGIRVRIDSKDIRPGEDIESFIRRVIGETEVVLSLVSERSLLSPWVGMESFHTLYDEALRGGRKLISCYLDESFLDIGFRLAATRQIDAKIAEIDALLPTYAQQHMDTSDLNRQKSRLFDLRNNLGRILDRLRNSLCLDLREPMWDRSLPQLIAAIEES